jgi:hypothetical protein
VLSELRRQCRNCVHLRQQLIRPSLHTAALYGLHRPILQRQTFAAVQWISSLSWSFARPRFSFGTVCWTQEPDTLSLKPGKHNVKQRRLVHSHRSEIKISTTLNSDALASQVTKKSAVTLLWHFLHQLFDTNSPLGRWTLS